VTAPVLSTKLFIPPRRANAVARPRLVERLAAGSGGKLSLVTAPAGFGKTTLVTEWLAEHPERAIAWVSLEADDSEPARFLVYLLAAVRTVHPEFGADLLNTLHAPKPPDPGRVARDLLNEWAKDPRPLVLVWDDYHVITDETTHQLVDTLVDHAPPHVHFVITSRDLPPLSLPRWRARAQLTEITAADLRFTLPEAHTFLNQTLGLSLSEQFTETLEARTEGWAAGLQLAAISLRGADNADFFPAAFTGQDRRVADYLLSEVLDRQPDETRDFLLNTSILERFNAPLCAAVLDRDDPSNLQRFLETLEATDLFIIPLDNERRWFRYHHLFAEMLQQRLKLALKPDEIAGLHVRAAGWFERDGQFGEAVRQALQAEDYEYAARLIAQIPLYQLWDQVAASRMLRWARELPESALQAVPQAAVRIMYVYDLRGDTSALQHALDQAEGQPEIEGERAVFAGVLARIKGDLNGALEKLRAAADQISEEDIPIRSIAAIQTANCLYAGGDFEAAEAVLSELLGRLPPGQKTTLNFRFEVVDLLATIERARGDYFHADRLLQGSMFLAQQPGVVAPQIGLTAFQLGSVRYQWNELADAEKYFEQASAWGERSGVTEISLNALFGMLNLHIARGDLEKAAASLEKFRAVTLAEDIEMIQLSSQAIEAEFALRMGDLAAARAWAESTGFSFEDPPAMIKITPYLALTAIRLAESRAQGDPNLMAGMVPFLDGMIDLVGAFGHVYFLVRLQLFRALALDLLDEKREAVTTLHKALALAEPGQLLRLFLDQGAPMQALLENSLSYGEHLPFVRRLLVAFAEEAGVRGEDGPVPTPDTGLPEALTEREFEILQLIAAGLTNKGIAEKLVISGNTVRTHIKNLYGKLAVNSRTQAVVRAREAGLLD
jgi:LuxR family maltose regulon positive regulatory protein